MDPNHDLSVLKSAKIEVRHDAMRCDAMRCDGSSVGVGITHGDHVCSARVDGDENENENED
jgi:hypothetical protein